ncbi:MAG: RNA pseudouridine synthase [Candidatus Omnitrophica bacterium]|nr:RNA pseudouridine synthase [Candidatus Omnitrophota bacterium]MBU4478706.1 RNA pseudouridine synthase [Candidatus Omnitrophota bacterium]MCG2703161.1 RNA pseudouridine synthase [Candidatus Omnitrophota bacterium]
MASFITKQISYEDDCLIIVNKPSGLLVVPAQGETRKDLTAHLNDYLGSGGKNIAAYPCHRIDKETSGVIIFAKSKAFQHSIMEQFRERKVKKEYIAFVQGKLAQRQGVLEGYIQGAWPYNRKEKKKFAQTRFRVVGECSSFSVVRVEPMTGRTNQIRIQFRDFQHPLLGERRFAFARDWPLKFRRTALHAAVITFVHPVYKQKMTFTAPLAQDMTDFLKQHGMNRDILSRL